MEVAMAVAGIASSAVGSVVSFMGQKAATKQSKRQEQLRKQQMNLESGRARRGEIRQAMLKRQQIAAQAESQGAGDTSGSMGAQGSVSTASANNRLAINNTTEIGNKIFASREKEADALGRASAGNLISGLGGSLFNMSSSPVFS